MSPKRSRVSSFAESLVPAGAIAALLVVTVLAGIEDELLLAVVALASGLLTASLEAIAWRRQRAEEHRIRSHIDRLEGRLAIERRPGFGPHSSYEIENPGRAQPQPEWLVPLRMAAERAGAPTAVAFGAALDAQDALANEEPVYVFVGSVEAARAVELDRLFARVVPWGVKTVRTAAVRDDMNLLQAISAGVVLADRDGEWKALVTPSG